MRPIIRKILEYTALILYVLGLVVYFVFIWFIIEGSSGFYKTPYYPPDFLYLLPYFLMMAVPPALIIYARRIGSGWKHMLKGAGLWFFGWVGAYMFYNLTRLIDPPTGPKLLLYFLGMAMYGIFLVGMVYMLIGTQDQPVLPWPEVVGIGTGFGCTPVLQAALFIYPYVVYGGMSFENFFKVTLIEALLYIPAIPGVFLSVGIMGLGCSVLIAYAHLYGEKRWLWLVFGGGVLLTILLSSFIIFLILGVVGPIWLVVLFFILLEGAAAGWGVWKIGPRYRALLY